MILNEFSLSRRAEVRFGKLKRTCRTHRANLGHQHRNRLRELGHLCSERSLGRSATPGALNSSFASSKVLKSSSKADHSFSRLFNMLRSFRQLRFQLLFRISR
jgi:hypothetical protein